jgi:curved DNA-binding protein CbpA
MSTVCTLSDRDYYQILGVDRVASVHEIVEAYRSALRTFHPDRYATERDARRVHALTRLCARINEAHRVLGRPAARTQYDAALAHGEKRVADTGTVSRPRYHETRDPITEHARTLYDKGCAHLERGEIAAARAQLALALQLEKTSPAIKAAYEQVAGVSDEESPPAVVGDDGAARDTESRAERLAKELLDTE